MKIYANDTLDRDVYDAVKTFAAAQGIELKRARNLRKDLFVPAADLTSDKIDRAERLRALRAIDHLTTAARGFEKLRALNPNVSLRYV